MDRTIKRGFTLALGASVARAASEPGAPSDKVVLGVVGVGGRGTQLTHFFCRRPDVEVAWICDVNGKRLEPAGKIVQQAKGALPKPRTTSAGFWTTNPWMPSSMPPRALARRDHGVPGRRGRLPRKAESHTL